MPTPDWFPRFADIKSVEDLSKLLAFPMIISAHVLQTGLAISVPEMSIDIPLPSQLSGSSLLLVALLIFAAKAIYVSLCTVALQFCVVVIEKYSKIQVHFLAAALLMAIGITGVLAQNTTTISALGIVSAWYYAAFVFGFYLLAWHKENFDE